MSTVERVERHVIESRLLAALDSDVSAKVAIVVNEADLRLLILCLRCCRFSLNSEASKAKMKRAEEFSDDLSRLLNAAFPSARRREQQNFERPG